MDYPATLTKLIARTTLSGITISAAWQYAAVPVAGLCMLLMQSGLTKGYEADVVKTNKADDGTATVCVKLYNGDKNAMIDFKLKKEDGFFGEWKITGTEKHK